MASERLLDRARAFEDWIEKAFVDPKGIVYTYLDTKTGAALTDDSFGSGQVPMHLPGTEAYTPAQWHNYENCGMTTGAYLQALLYRYAMDQDPAALARARRCFEAIRYVYDIGRQLEEGFFPKIYGNRFSEQTSTDQVLYAVLALDHFHQYATPAEQAQASRMIDQMIRFWVRREYRYKYFWTADMLWPLGRFTSLLLLAYKHSGDSLFKHEYDRLLAMGVNAGPIEARLAPKLAGEVEPLPYENEHQAWLIGEMEGAVSMDIMELDYLLRHDPHNAWAPTWKQSIRKIWDEAKLALAPDGTQYVHVLVDMKTGQPRRPEPGFFRDSNGPDDWIGFRYTAGARSADSTFYARSAVQVEPHLHDPDMRQAARWIIQSIDPQAMRSYFDPDRYLPELKHRTELYSGDGATNWLWAYWQGRSNGVFSETDPCNSEALPMKTDAIVFEAPFTVGLRSLNVRKLQDGEVLVRTRYSTISPGTELRTLAGREKTASPFPLIPGYSTVGQVVDFGSQVRGLHRGMMTSLRGGLPLTEGVGSSWGGHARYLIAPQEELFILPDDVDLKHATLITLLATALHGIDMARVRIREQVAVVGLGLVGQLCARLLRYCGANVVATDLIEHRLEVARRANIPVVCSAGSLQEAFAAHFPHGAEAVVDATGSSRALKASLQLLRARPRQDPCGSARPDASSPTARSAFEDLREQSHLNNGWHGPRLIAQGSYADPIEIDYYDLFNSEVGFVVPRVHELKEMFRAIDLQTDPRFSLEGLITQTLPYTDAATAYRTLRENPRDLITICFDWGD